MLEKIKFWEIQKNKNVEENEIFIRKIKRR
jgi:hypothetical protein